MILLTITLLKFLIIIFAIAYSMWFLYHSFSFQYTSRIQSLHSNGKIGTYEFILVFSLSIFRLDKNNFEQISPRKSPFGFRGQKQIASRKEICKKGPHLASLLKIDNHWKFQPLIFQGFNVQGFSISPQGYWTQLNIQTYVLFEFQNSLTLR